MPTTVPWMEHMQQDFQGLGVEPGAQGRGSLQLAGGQGVRGAAI